MAVKVMIIACALAVLSGMAAATTMTSELSVATTGVQTATMLHYAYLKDASQNLEPAQISIIGKGAMNLESRDLNYLVNGHIDFHDKVEYSDGSYDQTSESNTPKRGSYASHKLSFGFEGAKCITQFFSHVLFSNLSQASAQKELRHNDPGALTSGKSSRIDLDASVEIGLREVLETAHEGYDFDWDVNISNFGANLRLVTVQANSAKGDVNISDGLYALNPYPSLSAQMATDGWLPCGSESRLPCYDKGWLHIDRDRIFS
jgi:hypothetical protein